MIRTYCCRRFFILICLAALVASAAAQGTVKSEKTPYGGWPNCIRLSNGTVDLVATTDVGPRVIRYGLSGKENEFYEDPAQMGKTNASEWLAFGGHRLWLAPEAKPRSYEADSRPVQARVENGVLRMIQPVEAVSGMQKEIEVTLAPTGSHVKVVHRLTNRNVWEVEVAPWALTVMAGKGMAIFPQEPYSPHPDIPDTPGQKIDKKYYLPVRALALWSYTNLQDPRWTISPKYLILRQDPAATRPQKVGLTNQQSWGAYLRNGHLFVKKVVYQPGANYPDFGCSFETFTNPVMLELESLGPLVRLAPGAGVTHQEDWYLFDGVKIDGSDASIDSQVLPKVQGIFK